MKREKLGIAMACLWLAMLSYGSFPLELSAAGLAIPCVAFALLLLAGFHMERWPVWKAALLSCLGSGIGMLVRYFAEYGEAWWNANFTAENAVRHCHLSDFSLFGSKRKQIEKTGKGDTLSSFSI